MQTAPPPASLIKIISYFGERPAETYLSRTDWPYIPDAVNTGNANVPNDLAAAAAATTAAVRFRPNTS